MSRTIKLIFSLVVCLSIIASSYSIFTLESDCNNLYFSFKPLYSHSYKISQYNKSSLKPLNKEQNVAWFKSDNDYSIFEENNQCANICEAGISQKNANYNVKNKIYNSTPEHILLKVYRLLI